MQVIDLFHLKLVQTLITYIKSKKNKQIRIFTRNLIISKHINLYSLPKYWDSHPKKRKLKRLCILINKIHLIKIHSLKILVFKRKLK
jgi:hypothetical protein